MNQAAPGCTSVLFHFDTDQAGISHALVQLQAMIMACSFAVVAACSDGLSVFPASQMAATLEEIRAKNRQLAESNLSKQNAINEVGLANQTAS